MRKKFLLLSCICFLFVCCKVFSLGIAATPDSAFPKVKVTGFARARYTVDTTEHGTDTFNITTARIGINGSVSDKVSFALSLEKTNADNTNNKELYDVYIDITSKTIYKLRIGQFKYRFGLEQTTADADLEFINKSDVVDNLVKPTRDMGFEISRSYTKKAWNANYAFTFVNGSGSNQTDENQDKTVIGRIVYSPKQGIELGFSGFDGKTNTANPKKRGGIDIKYEINKSLFKSEYVSGKDGSIKKKGWYMLTAYNVAPATVFLLRYDKWEPDIDHSLNEKSRWTIGINYFLDKNVLIRTNYEIKKEIPSMDNDLLITQIQVKF